MGDDLENFSDHYSQKQKILNSLYSDSSYCL